MVAQCKVLIPNKSWIVEERGAKVGTIEKLAKGFSFVSNGTTMLFNNASSINERFGFEFTEVTHKATSPCELIVHDFPCNSKPYNPVFDVQRKLPLYTKGEKSKSVYCAGYYAIKFQKGWVKSFCPKLLTISRNSFHGPFKTESELKRFFSVTLRHHEC